jgi:hypothetical protein
MRRAWAAFQRTGGSKRVRMLVSICVVHMADAGIEALFSFTLGVCPRVQAFDQCSARTREMGTSVVPHPARLLTAGRQSRSVYRGVIAVPSSCPCPGPPPCGAHWRSSPRRTSRHAARPINFFAWKNLTLYADRAVRVTDWEWSGNSTLWGGLAWHRRGRRPMMPISSA